MGVLAAQVGQNYERDRFEPMLPHCVGNREAGVARITPGPADGECGAFSLTDTSLRVLLHPLDELLLGDNQPVTDFQNRKIRLVHQFVAAGRSDAQHFCHRSGIQEQR